MIFFIFQLNIQYLQTIHGQFLISSYYINQIMKQQAKQNIKVVVRIRPLLQFQLKKKQSSCVTSSPHQLKIMKNGLQKQFTFDEVFNQSITQQQIYQTIGFASVQAIPLGYHATILAYGQTGSGKTFTMNGVNAQNKQGMIQRAFSHLLNITQTQQKLKFILKVSFIEIYNQEIIDLLSNKDEKKTLKQSPQKGFFVKDLISVPVKSKAEFEKYYQMGNHKRITKSTAMNAVSSRSHSILVINLQVMQVVNGKNTFRQGKLNLVDLAGSQRQKKTESQGQRLKQAIKINLSLIALSNVITALVDGKKNAHIPYRDSILTKILQDSFGGKTKTTLIANISPSDFNYDQTLSTLRYATRASMIKNTPVIHEDPKDMLIKQYIEQIKRLKQLANGQPNLNLKNERIKIQSEMQSKYKSQLQKKNEEKIMLQQQKNKMDNILKQEQKNNQQLKLKLKQLEQLFINTKQIKQEDKKKKKKKRKQMFQKYKKNQQINFSNKKKIEQEQDQIFHYKQSKFKNNQEQIQKLKKINEKLREKYIAAKNQIKDINREFQIQRQSYLESIRELEKDNAFYIEVCGKFLSLNQLEIIKSNSQYIQQKHQYKLVPFMLKYDKLHFPKLSQNQVQDLLNNDKAQRKLELMDSKGFNLNNGNINDQKKTKKKGFDSQKNIDEKYKQKTYDKQILQMIKAEGSQYLTGHNMHISQKILKNYEQKADKISTDSRNSAKNFQSKFKKFQVPTPPLSRQISTPSLRKLEPIKGYQKKKIV